VQRLLNGRFACSWENTAGDASCGASFAHSPKDPPPSCLRGNGEHNIQTLFATREGELVHVVAGYVSGEELRREAEFALEILAKLEKAHGHGRTSIVRAAHEERLAAIEKEESDGEFAGFAKSRRLQDHRYAAEHALMPLTEFRAEELVGKGSSFFGSSSGGTPDRRLGDEKALRRPGEKPGR
jgi:hypothetical protein